MNLEEILRGVPDSPVDGYVVKYWQLSMSAAWAYINEMTATYYVNTPWNKYKPNDTTKGAALKDDWLVSSGSSAEGRISGWKNIRLIKSVHHFATEKEAIQEAIQRFDDYIKQTYKQLEELNSMRVEMVNRLEPIES